MAFHILDTTYAGSNGAPPQAFSLQVEVRLGWPACVTENAIDAKELTKRFDEVRAVEALRAVLPATWRRDVQGAG